MTPTRRTFLQAAAAIAAAAVLPKTPLFAEDAALKGQILDQCTIAPNETYGYNGWPTIATLPNGDLMVVTSGGREGHVCPLGRVDMYRSSDGGKTWSPRRTILDHPADDRDAGICVTSKGTILVTSFTSFGFADMLAEERKRRAEGKGTWSDGRFNLWSERLKPFESKEAQEAELGCWMIRSEDGGKTWSERYSSIVNSPHGPIQLKDGRLLYPGKILWGKEAGKIGVCESLDDGKTWRWLADIPMLPDLPNSEFYHELHGVECNSGRIVVQIRCHAPGFDSQNLQSESEDGGKTWTTAHTIGVWGIPSHLMKLADGRILMTYGHRRDPWGWQARVSADEGRSWSEPILKYTCKPTDLGYPATAQRKDGKLVTVWYEGGNLKSALWE